MIQDYNKLPAFAPFLSKVENLITSQPLSILAIDGKCGSGKSTFASFLANKYGSYTIHMDDFFLPKELRTDKRLLAPGGNVHYERFTAEVVLPLMKRKEDLANHTFSTDTFSYRIFNCRHMDYGETVTLSPKSLVVIEGSYSMRPEFRSLYDCTLFMDIPPVLQKERLLSRVGEERCKDFETRWIPMENRYFSHYNIKEQCDYSVTIE